MSLFIIAIILIVAIIIAFVFLIMNVVKKLSGNEESEGLSKNKDRNSIIKSANRRLEQNPKDTQATLELANLYFSEEAYDKSLHLFKLLLDKTGSNPTLSEVDIIFKYAISALKTGKIDEAYKYLMYARSKDKENFETNFNLGIIDFDRKSYEKALSFFVAAKNILPDHAGTHQYIGRILFNTGRQKEAVAYLKKSYELAPGNKEILYLLGQSYNDAGQIDNAYKIFSHLRPDPLYGPSSSLECGKIDIKRKDYEKASEDLNLGLKHKEIDPKIRLELLYLLSGTYIRENKMNAALKLFDIILSISPDYKDVASQKVKYGELASNKNLNIYLMSPMSEFVNLCRRICPLLYPRETVKITDVSVNKNDYVDIVAEITSEQIEDIALFRFIRSSTPVGDLMLRDLYFKSKDVRAGQSYCFTAGSFSETAAKFVEARTIDLISDKQLMSLLKKANTSH